MFERGVSNIAKSAVELKLFLAESGEVAFAVMLAAMVQDSNAFRLEVLAARCGITEPVADRIIFNAHRGAALIGEAHQLLMKISQLGLEAEVAELITKRSEAMAAKGIVT